MYRHLQCFDARRILIVEGKGVPPGRLASRHERTSIMTTQVYAPSWQPSKAAVEAEHLLVRYPHLTERELDRLLRKYPYLPMRELSLMMGDSALSQKISALERDHADTLKAPVSALVAGLLFVALVAFALLWAIGNHIDAL